MKFERLNLESFETLTEISNGTLVNGFSEAFEPPSFSLYGGGGGSNVIGCHETNNCQGANCITGCGVK